MYQMFLLMYLMQSILIARHAAIIDDWLERSSFSLSCIASVFATS